MSRIAKALDRWFGRGEASITTPPMDGAFRPNDLLDAAPVALEAPKPDALAVTSQGLLVSLGRSLKRVDKLENKTVASFDAEISALTGLPDGGAAAGADQDVRARVQDGRARGVEVAERQRAARDVDQRPVARGGLARIGHARGPEPGRHRQRADPDPRAGRGPSHRLH